MKKTMILLAALCSLLIAASASAHMLWINAYKSEKHYPNHVLTSIGYGHALPLDDILLSGKDSIGMAEYFVADPSGKHHALHLADDAYKKPTSLCTGLKAQPGNLSINKIILSDDAAPGTYQVAVRAQENFFTAYLDKAGKKKHALKSMDSISDASKTLVSIRYSANGKSFFTIGKWTQPKPLGFDLEVIPLSDLSNVRAGDLVKFKVLMNGKPLTSSHKGIESITAQSTTFGGPDGFAITSKLYKGVAKFRVPSAGQWVVNARTRRQVGADPALAKLKGKTQSQFYMASATFTAKP